ncbi:MAG: hypothetical protein NTU89_00445 [Candidatus Dependentiae bacterium]|nr:hypothetical protein [Candidatus Dependentiae bacterium]
MKKALHKKIIFAAFAGLTSGIYSSALSRVPMIEPSARRLPTNSLTIPHNPERRNPSPSKRPIAISGRMVREYSNGPALISLARIQESNQPLKIQSYNSNQTSNGHNVSPDLAAFAFNLPNLQYVSPIRTGNNNIPAKADAKIDIKHLCAILENLQKLQDLEEKQASKSEYSPEDDTKSDTYNKWFR